MNEQFLRRIETPPDVATGTGGEPGLVVIKTRLKGKYTSAFNEAGQLAAELAAIDTAAMTPAIEAKAIEMAGRLGELTDRIYEAYSNLVVAWNWVDFDSGQPLPPPDNAAVFRDELDNIQMGWLREQIQGVLKYRSTEGNGRSGGGS